MTRGSTCEHPESERVPLLAGNGYHCRGCEANVYEDLVVESVGKPGLLTSTDEAATREVLSKLNPDTMTVEELAPIVVFTSV